MNYSPLEKQLRRNARALVRTALRAADAGEAIKRNVTLEGERLQVGSHRLNLSHFDRIHLFAVGKAAPAMAAGLERILGLRLSTALVLTKHGHANRNLKMCSTLTASHPVPDESGLAASAAVDAMLRGLNARDLLLVAVSGGASALLPAPVAGLTLAEKQATTDQLLRAGADIFELNAVRKHLSALKGGRLAALAYPATVVGLLLSDVIGDPADVIGSGLTAPDRSTYGEALAVLARYGIESQVPPPVLRHLKAGREGDIPETPKPGDPLFRNVSNVIVGSNRLSLAAAATLARTLGYKPIVLSSTVAGEARDAARVLTSILREAVLYGSPAKAPVCLLAGGETTVTVRGSGKGGRNQEFALAAALEMRDLPNALILSLGTDGTDGPTDAAGAIATGTTLLRAGKLGLDPAAALAANDSYRFFDALGDHVKTGPTGTNVMDIHLLLSRASSSKR